MKKISLFMTLFSLFAIVACSTKASSESSISSQSTSEGEVSSTSSSSSDFSSTSSSSSSSSSTSLSSSSVATDVLVEKLTFSKASVDLIINRGYQVEYTIEPANASNKNLRWASSDYVVAAVTKEGRITALSEGTAIISATTRDGSNISTSLTVNVSPIAVNELSLEVSNKEMKVGDIFQIEPLIYPSNATYQDVSYVSSNQSIASVNKNGLVTANKQGEVDITVSCQKYPDITAICHIKVEAIIAEKLLYRLSDIEMKEEESYFFSPTVIPTTTTNKKIIYSNDNPEVVSVSETGEIYALKKGEATVKAVSESNPELSTSLKVVVKGKDELVKTTLSYTYKDFANNNIYNIDNANYPTTHALVIPVWFTDSSNYITNKDEVREDIEKAYFGTNEETGWRSVKTFYEEEGRGRYTLTGEVTAWFECNLPSSNFDSRETDSTNTENLVSTAVSWYKKTYSVSNMKDFDADCNGYIDSVILIYAAPDYLTSENYNNDNLWAYCSWIRKESYRNYDDPGANAYFWASYDFMYSKDNPHASKGYGGGDTSHCAIDTHTYIHEFGHILGLNDYYDYSSQYKPASGFSMQDENVGGHDPYSLLTYGFVDPYVVNDSTTITINDFQSSGDVVLLADKHVNSPFDEYFLLELYTPTGLNEFDTLYQYSGVYPQGVNEAGLRIWHVDGRLLYGDHIRNFTAEKTTSNPLINGSKVWNMMSNTYYTYETAASGSPLGKDYMDYNELQLMRNKADATYRSTDAFSSDCLFKQGDIFSLNKFNGQFVNKYYLNDGSLFPFSVEVTKIENNQATLTITK